MSYNEVWRLFDEAIAAPAQEGAGAPARKAQQRSDVARWHVVFGERQRPLFVPRAPSGIQQKCISFFHTSPLNLRYAQYLLRVRGVLPEATLSDSRLRTLIDKLRPVALSEAIAYVAVYAGTPSPNQKASLLFISRKGELLAVAKLALRATADRLVDNEASWLKRLASVPFIQERIPKLLAHGELASGRHYVVQSALPGSAKQQDFTESHIRFLTALGRSSLVAARYTDSKGFRALLESYARVRPTLDEAAARTLCAALEECSSRLAGWVGPLTLTHGEFSNWNISAQDDGIFVFDWEYAEEGANPLQDAVHYHLFRPAARGRDIGVQEFSSVMQRVEQFAAAAYPEWAWDTNIVTGLALVYLLRVVLYYAEVERVLHVKRPVTRTYMSLLRNITAPRRERRKSAVATQNLSILLSAYACEPDSGSEPGVGWQWAINLARMGNRVCVITWEANRDVIEASPERQQLPNLRFVYLGLPRLERCLRNGGRAQRVHYFLWQLAEFLAARRVARSERFDIAHHVTYSMARVPSLMGLHGIPFVFGPVAGGEYSPAAMWCGLGFGACLHESLRYASSLWVRFSPLMNLTFFSARSVFATSEQTAALLPRYAKARSSVLLGISADRHTEALSQLPLRQRGAGAPLQVFFAGRYLHWKGMDLGLKAFARLRDEVGSARLTMIGDGPMLPQWRKLADALQLRANISWRGSMKRTEFLRGLAQFDVLLFPSLHDSGGMVVMEAMAAGLPVVCLDVGGPGILVDKSCGFAIAPSHPAEVETRLFEALAALARDESLRSMLGKNARDRVMADFSWRKAAAVMQRSYRDALA